MNCRRRGSVDLPARPKDASKDGNDVFKGGDTHGMEFRPVHKDPEWDGATRVVKDQ